MKEESEHEIDCGDTCDLEDDEREEKTSRNEQK